MKPEINLNHPSKSAWQRKWLALDEVHPLIGYMGNEAENFCGRFYKNSPNPSLLVLAGKTGCGKTHTAKAIYNFCNAAAFKAFTAGGWGNIRVPNTFYLSWPEAAKGFAEKQFGSVEDAKLADLTVIDDVGAENDPWKICKDLICQILSRREDKFTVITTNVGQAQWSEVLDARISDRFFRNSVIVDLSEVPSYAKKI